MRTSMQDSGGTYDDFLYGAEFSGVSIPAEDILGVEASPASPQLSGGSFGAWFNSMSCKAAGGLMPDSMSVNIEQTSAESALDGDGSIGAWLTASSGEAPQATSAPVQNARGRFGAWLNGALSDVTTTLASAMNAEHDTSGRDSQDKSIWTSESIFRSRAEKELSLEDWAGTWEMEAKECYDALLECLGVDSDPRAPDREYHHYDVRSTGFTMDHHLLARLFHSGRSGSLHLSFHADLDGTWHDSPYPRRDAQGGEAPLQWKNSWEEEPTCFTSELSNFAGQDGLSVIIMRHLTCNSRILLTTKIFDKGELKKTSHSTMRKVVSPVPIFSGDAAEEYTVAEAFDDDIDSQFSATVVGERSIVELEACGPTAEAGLASASRHCREFSGSAFASMPRSTVQVSMQSDLSTPAKPRRCRMSTASTDVSSCLSSGYRSHCCRTRSSWASIEEEESFHEPVGGRPLLTSLPVPLDIQAWEWPLSRNEKKSLLLMYDRQVLALQRDERANQVNELIVHRDQLTQQLMRLRASRC